MVKYVVFAAIDSWNIANGIHCASNFGCFDGQLFDSVEDCYKAVKEWGERYGYLMKVEISKTLMQSKFMADYRKGVIKIYPITLSNEVHKVCADEWPVEEEIEQTSSIFDNAVVY